MVTQETEAPLRTVRRLQVSLRTSLVLMLFVAVGLGWLGLIVQRGREQRAALHDLGGTVYYFDPSNFLQRNNGLRQLLGDDSLLHVRALDLGEIRITNADLVHLERLPELRALVLGNSRWMAQRFKWPDSKALTDAGLAHLKRLTHLRYLDLTDTLVSDAGLDHLTALTQLEELVLYDTEVTDTGVQKLKTVLPNCKIRWSTRSRVPIPFLDPFAFNGMNLSEISRC